MISLVKENASAVIKIVDNGIGITEQNIANLLNGTAKSNKTNGKGLGFKYSKSVIEHFGGKIELQSKQTQGTTQIITLPLLTQKPAWFIDKINISKYNQIVILDDNEAVFEMYKQKFALHTLTHFTKAIDFENAINSTPNNTFFIIDYSLDSVIPTGLDLIKKYSLQSNAILSTSMYLDGKIKEKCNQLNIKLLSKSLIEKLILI